MIALHRCGRMVLHAAVASCLAPVMHVVAAQNDSEARHEAKEIARAIGKGVRGRQSIDHAKELERQLRHLDSLPTSVDDEKIISHAVMVDYYSEMGMPAMLEYHARSVIAAALRLDPGMQAKMAPIIFKDYEAMADLRLQAGSARDADAILTSIPAPIMASPAIARQQAFDRMRLRLIGRPAPSLDAPSWINAPKHAELASDAIGTDSTRHPVRLIEFTAWWCGPCQDSYAYLHSLPQRFPGDSIDVVLAIERMGQFQGMRNLSRSEEDAKLTNYFVKEHKLSAPVAVADSGGPPVSTYYVDEYPEIVVVGADGLVRTVLLGWDATVAQQLTDAIRKALHQTAGSTFR